jgi:hypothetical protein
MKRNSGQVDEAGGSIGLRITSADGAGTGGEENEKPGKMRPVRESDRPDSPLVCLKSVNISLVSQESLLLCANEFQGRAATR